MAATQRPATQEALGAVGRASPVEGVPSWFLIAEQDRNIPAALQRFMAERAGARRADRDRGRVARGRSVAPRRDGSADPRSRGAARRRLTRLAVDPRAPNAGATRRVSCRESPAELAARADVELGEDLAQVVLDGARADEQLRADLGVRAAVAGEPGDLRLLRRERVARLGGALARRLAGGQQLAAGALGERLGADRR